MIQTLFPYRLHVHIFQLCEYDPKQLINWILRHYGTRKTENKKPLIWTTKAKLIHSGSILLALFTVIILTYLFKETGFVVGLVLATQAFLFILLSYAILLPIEIYQKNQIKQLTAQKMKKLKRVTVIGVTGSYGKTSVKVFLCAMLRTQYKVLKTPESFNTPYGIAKVVAHELTDSYDYFICEMGAYHPGDIKEICDIVHPKYGILTGINEQHLDKFQTIENIIHTKFELIDAIPNDGFGVINEDNELILKEKRNHNKQMYGYGFGNKLYSMKTITTSPQGSSFTLVLNGKSYSASTKLIGFPNLQNILGAATMSYKLGIKPENIIKAINDMKPVPHRLEIQEKDTMILIDNAYNSNTDGFKESLHLLSTFSNPKVLITPGIVELGEQTYAIHKELGKLTENIDHIILVGKSERTRGLQDGIKQQKKVTVVNSIHEAWALLKELKLKKPVVLLENDLPDNY